ncbi:MAG: glycosyltransferase [Deltaproteobacteria bacterium]|jgi:spore maturation protein CgeB|nr:glycosyltransferase [Deltaproteobacteria bacterium]
MTLLTLNLKALEKARPAYHRWLTSPDRSGPEEAIAYAVAKTGQRVMVINGQTQDSRRDPEKAAQDYLDRSLPPDVVKDQNRSFWFFGLGSPLTVLKALERVAPLNVLEPRRSVALKALEMADFSRAIVKGELIFWALADLSLAPAPTAKATLIAHPPSARAQKSRLNRLESYLAGTDLKFIPKDRPPKVMVIGPFSGGSISMGPSLLRAGLALNLPTRLVAFSPKALDLAVAVKNGHSPAGPLMAQALAEIQEAVASFEPDLILALAQAPLTAESIRELKKFTPAVLAFWFVEDREVFSYVEEVAPAYDLFLHIQGSYMDATVQAWGLKRAFYLPLAADPEFFRPLDHVPREYQAQVSLMGAGYHNRRWILSDLLTDYWPSTKRPLNAFKIFGSGWEGAPPVLTPRLFARGRRVSAEECAYIYAGTAVNLNLHSAGVLGFNPRSAFVNPRTFEIAAAGACQLVDHRPLLADLFTEDEVAVVESPEELPLKIEYYLINPDLRKTMGEAARARVLAEHQYTHRLQTIIDLASDPF